MVTVKRAARSGSLPRPLSRPLRKAALTSAFAFCAFAAQTAGAQASPAASRSSDIAFFGAYTYSRPDFGPSIDTNSGGLIGVQYTHFFYHFIEPSVELRGGYTTGPNITQKDVVGGLRGSHLFDKRFQVYGDFLFGGGTIRYSHFIQPNLREDRGTVFSYGGGVTVDLIKNFQVIGDLQELHYNLGVNRGFVPDGGNFTLAPIDVSVGLAYRLPARSHGKTADAR